MIKSLILSAVAMLTSLGVSSGNAQRSVEVLNELKPKEAIRLNASYNDEQYQVTLSINELNNYSWNNLKEYVNSLTINPVVSVGSSWSYGEYSGTSIKGFPDSSYNYLRFDNSSEFANIGFNRNNDGQFTDTTKVDNKLSSDLLITLNATHYASIKQAIELDIVANTSSNNDSMPTIADIFGEIASAITSFVTTLGSAFNGVTALFYDSTNSNFTFLGVLVLIGCGVGLVYGAYRVIKGLMHRV